MPDDNLLATLLQKATSIQAPPPSNLERLASEAKEGIVGALGSNPIITKLLGSDPMEPDDQQFLRQFMRPTDNILEHQNLRPTLAKTPNLPFRRMPRPDHEDDLQDYSVTLKGGEPNILKTADGQTFPAMLPGEPALGHHTKSIGKDEIGPYLSIYDVWDFKSPVIGDLAGTLLNRLGQPYGIYDRYPLQQQADPNVFKFKKVR